MTIEALGAVSLSSLEAVPLATGSGASQGSDFLHAVGTGLQGLDGEVRHADMLASELAAGKGVAVHDVMIAMEQAHLSLQFAVEVRNRILDAYQNLTNMQL